MVTAALPLAQAAADNELPEEFFTRLIWQESRFDWRARAGRLHRSFIERNVSAGGCADLLACTTLVSRCCG